MSVLIDTTIWSLALRRRRHDLNLEERRLLEEWTALVKSGRAVLVGPIQQEILSGVRHQTDFVALQQRLSAFPQPEILPADYVQAAAFFNICRSRGIAATSVDLLVCAVAERLNIPIFTTDADFTRYAKVLPIRLHKPQPRDAQNSS